MATFTRVIKTANAALVITKPAVLIGLFVTNDNPYIVDTSVKLNGTLLRRQQVVNNSHMPWGDQGKLSLAVGDILVVSSEDTLSVVYSLMEL